MAEKRYTPSAPVTSVRVPCIEGLVIDTVTPGMTALLVSVILPLMAPVVVLTVWPIAPAATPNSSATMRTGIRHCSRLMGLLRDPRETRDLNAAGKGIVTPTGHDTEIVTPTGHYTGMRIKAIGFIAILIASDASAGSWIGSQRNCRFFDEWLIVETRTLWCSGAGVRPRSARQRRDGPAIFRIEIRVLAPSPSLEHESARRAGPRSP